MKIVLIGSPLSGKTTILKELKGKNIPIFSADTFIHEIYKKGNTGYDLIKKEFGNEFLNDDSVNRKAISNKIVKDHNFLLRLNELIHPLIKDYLDGKDGYVAELPIINNSSVSFKYDKIVLVTCSEDELKRRFEKKVKNINHEFIDHLIKK